MIPTIATQWFQFPISRWLRDQIRPLHGPSRTSASTAALLCATQGVRSRARPTRRMVVRAAQATCDLEAWHGLPRDEAIPLAGFKYVLCSTLFGDMNWPLCCSGCLKHQLLYVIQRHGSLWTLWTMIGIKKFHAHRFEWLSDSLHEHYIGLYIEMTSAGLVYGNAGPIKKMKKTTFGHNQPTPYSNLQKGSK